MTDRTIDYDLDPIMQRMVMDTVRTLNTMVDGLPALEYLPDLIATMDRALALGPILAPSEWMRGHENARAVLDLLRPLEQYRQAVKVARELADAAAS